MNAGLETAAPVAAGRHVYRPDRDIVATTVPGLRSVMLRMLSEGVRHLTIDLSQVQMVDSGGIGLLIAAHNSLRRTGGSLELTRVAPEIQDLFRSMRMDRHFRISGD